MESKEVKIPGKNEVLAVLGNQLDKLRLTIGGIDYGKDDLIRAVEEESDLGVKVGEIVRAEQYALTVLVRQPDNFRWTLEDITGAGTKDTYTRDELFWSVIDLTDLGMKVIGLISWSGLDAPRGPHQLGKRYKCLVCLTEFLCLKVSSGTVQCCGQDTVVNVPRPLPSSD